MAFVDKNRRGWKIVFFFYLLLIIKFVVFKYPPQELREIMAGWEKEVILEGLSTANFTPGKSIKMYIKYFDLFPFWNGIANLYGNLLAFIPLGILFPLSCKPKRIKTTTFFFSLAFVIAVELFQLVSAFGIFDVDDILLNVFGAMLGCVIYTMLVTVQPCDKKM